MVMKSHYDVIGQCYVIIVYFVFSAYTVKNVSNESSEKKKSKNFDHYVIIFLLRNYIKQWIYHFFNFKLPSALNQPSDSECDIQNKVWFRHLWTVHIIDLSFYGKKLSFKKYDFTMKFSYGLCILNFYIGNIISKKSAVYLTRFLEISLISLVNLERVQRWCNIILWILSLVSDEKWSLDLISLLLFTLNNIYTRRTESQGRNSNSKRVLFIEYWQFHWKEKLKIKTEKFNTIEGHPTDKEIQGHPTYGQGKERDQNGNYMEYV